MARKRHRSTGRRFLFCLVLLAVFLIGYNQIFRVQQVLVEGLDPADHAYVIALSGVQMNDSIFAVHAETVESSVTSDSYLAFDGMEIRYPDTVILRVRQRTAAGAVSASGVYVLIDDTGHVLENTTRLPEGMPFVTGVRIATANIGTKLTSLQSDQIDHLLSILAVLKEQGAQSLIAKVDVSDRNNLYLVTHDGVRAILGDGKLLSDKIMWLRASLAEMERMGYSGGELDLSSGKNAVFSPNQE